jgi:hypothetical protein
MFLLNRDGVFTDRYPGMIVMPAFHQIPEETRWELVKAICSIIHCSLPVPFLFLLKILAKFVTFWKKFAKISECLSEN